MNLSFPYSVELPEFSCEVSIPGDITCALCFRDIATSGSSAVLFGFLLSPLSLKPAVVLLNILNLTQESNCLSL